MFPQVFWRHVIAAGQGHHAALPVGGYVSVDGPEDRCGCGPACAGDRNAAVRTSPPAAVGPCRERNRPARPRHAAMRPGLPGRPCRLSWRIPVGHSSPSPQHEVEHSHRQAKATNEKTGTLH